MAWKEILGQEEALNLLKLAWQQRRLPNAYLFTGAIGVGKRLTAFQLAKTIMCQNQDLDSCESCRSCQKIKHRTHPDLFLIKPQGSNIAIDQIRQLQEQVSFHPLEAALKVAILEDAHTLSIEAANCLLKILEEPPSTLLFILISPTILKLPQTILSRCQKVIFKKLSKPVVQKILKDTFSLKDSEIEFISELIPGRIPLEILHELEAWLTLKEDFIKVLENLSFHEVSSIFEFTSRYSRRSPELVTECFQLCDLLILMASANLKYLINENKEAGLSAGKNLFASEQDWLNCLKITLQVREALEKNAHLQLALDYLLLQLAKIKEKKQVG